MTPTITIAGVWGYSANMTGFTLLFWFSWPHPLSPFDFQSAMRERNISAYDSWRPQLVPLSSSPPWERENDLPTTHDVQLPVPLFSSPACEWEKVICLRLLCPLSYQSPWFPGRTEWVILIGYDSWRPPTRHYDPEFRSSSWGSKSSSRCSSTTSHWARFRTGILHTQLGVPISISIPSIDRIICIPKRREQRTPYQSTPSGQRLDILSPSIPCRQSLETIYHKIYGVQQGGVWFELPKTIRKTHRGSSNRTKAKGIVPLLFFNSISRIFPYL